MRKRTPLEQAAYDQTRRGRYEKAQRDAGLVKTSLWVPADCLDDFRQVAKLLCSTNGDFREGLRLLANAKFHL